MGQVNSTFGRAIEGMTKAYADFYGLSFSNAIAVLTGDSVTKWWSDLSDEQKSAYNKRFKVFPTKPSKSIKK